MQTVSAEEFIETAELSAAEIRALRAQVAELAPKAKAYDALVTVLGFVPRQSQGYGVDLAFQLERRVDELRKDAAVEDFLDDAGVNPA